MKEYKTINELKEALKEKSFYGLGLYKKGAKLHKLSLNDYLYCQFWNSKKNVFEWV